MAQGSIGCNFTSTANSLQSQYVSGKFRPAIRISPGNFNRPQDIQPRSRYRCHEQWRWGV